MSCTFSEFHLKYMPLPLISPDRLTHTHTHTDKLLLYIYILCISSGILVGSRWWQKISITLLRITTRRASRLSQTPPFIRSSSTSNRSISSARTSYRTCKSAWITGEWLSHVICHMTIVSFIGDPTCRSQLES